MLAGEKVGPQVLNPILVVAVVGAGLCPRRLCTLGHPVCLCGKRDHLDPGRDIALVNGSENGIGEGSICLCLDLLGTSLPWGVVYTHIHLCPSGSSWTSWPPTTLGVVKSEATERQRRKETRRYFISDCQLSCGRDLKVLCRCAGQPGLVAHAKPNHGSLQQDGGGLGSTLRITCTLPIIATTVIPLHLAGSREECRQRCPTTRAIIILTATRMSLNTSLRTLNQNEVHVGNPFARPVFPPLILTRRRLFLQQRKKRSIRANPLQ